MAEDAPTIEDYYHEDRTFPPSPEFVASANLSTTLTIYQRAAVDAPAFWAEQARSMLDWDEPTSTPHSSGTCPDAKWFVGGRLNVSYNCVDRHVEAGLGDRVALHWEGEPGDTRTITYSDLLADVQPVRQRAVAASGSSRATASSSTCR